MLDALKDVATRKPDREYLKGLWWHMHHYYSPERAPFCLTAYMDDSGSDDLSPLTTISGLVMTKDAFIDFGDKWRECLRQYRIFQPLHMIEFVRPHGKLIGIPFEMKLALFNDVNEIISQHKAYSISVAVDGQEFDSLLPTEVRRKVIGPYALAFFGAVLIIRGFSAYSKVLSREVTSFLVDSGFSGADQLVNAHAQIVKAGVDKHPYVGSLTFDTDERVSALQAADVISWSARRRDLKNLDNEFKPLNALFCDRHEHLAIPRDAIEMFAKPINNWLTLGKFPSMEELMQKPNL